MKKILYIVAALCLSLGMWAQDVDSTLNRTIDEVEVIGKFTSGITGSSVKTLQIERQLSSASVTAAEAIRQLPSVVTDIEGGITFRGSNQSGLFINGIPYGLLEEYSGTEAEKIMRQHRWDENIGRLHTTEIIQNLENELHEVGVRLTEKQQDTLMRLIVQYHNGSRLWCLRGWKPNELADIHGNSDVPSISFGPGLQQAFADGIMDKGDLVRKIQELGWKVME